MKSATLSRHKDAATSFLHLVSSGQVREAFETYTAPTFRHHNVYFPGDATSLAAAMEENARANPQKNYEVKQVVEEGDLVVVHGWVQHKPGDPEYALVHIFRFEDERIVELWDIGQEILRDSPNKNGAY